MRPLRTLFALLVAGASAPGQSELGRAVDLPDPKSRRAAAAELAAKKDVSLEALLAAMRSFGTFEKHAPGVADQSVALWNGKATEEMDLTVYVPASYDRAKPSPLMLVLHGAGGNGRHMHSLWKDESEKLGMLVLSPTDAAAKEGYAYTDRERITTLSAVRWARRRFNVDEQRVFGCGVSRGGHLLWDLALRTPDLFAAIAPFVGSPRVAPAAQNNMRYLANVAELPIRQLQGARDDAAMVGNVRQAFEKLKALGAKDAKLVEFAELGHEFDMRAVDWVEFLGAAKRDPAPDRVVRACARAGEGRSSWVEVLGTTDAIQDSFVQKVKESEWKAMDDAAKRRSFEAEVEKKTARLVVSRAGLGKFAAEGTGVQKFRLLLREGDFDPAKPVEVTFQGKTVSRRVTPSKSVLLMEFVERFDRTFLPIAEFTVP